MNANVLLSQSLPALIPAGKRLIDFSLLESFSSGLHQNLWVNVRKTAFNLDTAEPPFSQELNPA